MKRIMLFLFTLSLFTLFGQVSHAKTDNYYVAEKIVDIANTQINNLIIEAQEDAKEIPFAVGTVEYNAALDVIVNDLVYNTNTIASITIKITAILDVTVVCEYETYDIGGRLVEIDPLRVHDW